MNAREISKYLLGIFVATALLASFMLLVVAFESYIPVGIVVLLLAAIFAYLHYDDKRQERWFAQRRSDDGPIETEE